MRFDNYWQNCTNRTPRSNLVLTSVNVSKKEGDWICVAIFMITTTPILHQNRNPQNFSKIHFFFSTLWSVWHLFYKQIIIILTRQKHFPSKLTGNPASVYPAIQSSGLLGEENKPRYNSFRKELYNSHACLNIDSHGINNRAPFSFTPVVWWNICFEPWSAEKWNGLRWRRNQQGRTTQNWYT